MKDLCIRESYEKDGETKVSWNKIGVLLESNGKQYVKLFHIPNTLISVFEQKKKEEKQHKEMPKKSVSGGAEIAWDK